jgi:hypothetical protein
MKFDIRLAIAAMALVTGLVFATRAYAQSGPAQSPQSAGAQAPSPPAPAEYRPSLGDMMTMAVQPRHIKLWLAAEKRNWVYAAYELDELKNAFARIGRTIPVYRNMNVAEIANSAVATPLAALDAAIKASDSAAFTRAYRDLTEGCNACHVTGQHPMVVVKVPGADAFPDQDFRPRPN